MTFIEYLFFLLSYSYAPAHKENVNLFLDLLVVFKYVSSLQLSHSIFAASELLLTQLSNTTLNRTVSLTQLFCQESSTVHRHYPLLLHVTFISNEDHLGIVP